jgi:hypothetical protein
MPHISSEYLDFPLHMGPKTTQQTQKTEVTPAIKSTFSEDPTPIKL